MKRARYLLLSLAVPACLAGNTDKNGDAVPTFEVRQTAFTRAVSAEGLLKPVKTTVLTAPSGGFEVLTISWMADDGTAVKKGDVVVRFDPTDASRWLETGQADRQAAERRIEKERAASDSSLGERQRIAAVTKEELQSARQLGKKDPRYFPRSEVIESEIDEGIYKTRLAHARATQGVEQKLAASTYDLLAVDRQHADVRTRQARRALAALELRAPHDGTFLVERFGGGGGGGGGNNRRTGMLKTGDRAFRGMRVGEVATSEQMTAEVYILEGDAAGLVVGKSATVVLEARPDVTMKAHVTRVDPFPKTIEPEVPAQYFVTVLDIEGKTAGLKPGQRLHASLVLDQQDKALVVPRQAVFQRADDTLVYRQRTVGRGFEAVKVRLGPGTVGRIVVADGLRPGDQVALRDPGRSLDETFAGKGKAGAAGGAGSPGHRSVVQ